MKWALGLVLLATTAGAADWSDPQALMDKINASPMLSEGDWRSMVAGRTVTYAIDGELFAREFYVSNSNRVVISLADGLCLNGQWFMEGPAFCYAWENNAPDCFTHHQTDEGVFIIGVNSTPLDIEIQEVFDIRTAVVQCGAELLSGTVQAPDAL